MDRSYSGWTASPILLVCILSCTGSRPTETTDVKLDALSTKVNGLADTLAGLRSSPIALSPGLYEVTFSAGTEHETLEVTSSEVGAEFTVSGDCPGKWTLVERDDDVFVFLWSTKPKPKCSDGIVLRCTARDADNLFCYNPPTDSSVSPTTGVAQHRR